jgi:hypothetical protein
MEIEILKVVLEILIGNPITVTLLIMGAICIIVAIVGEIPSLRDKITGARAFFLGLFGLLLMGLSVSVAWTLAPSMPANPTSTFNTPAPTATNTLFSISTDTPEPSTATLSLSTPTPVMLSRCEITRGDFPQSIEAIAVKFNLPIAVIFDIIRENCGPTIVDGFILRSGTAVTLQVPEGGCIDAPPDAVYTEPTVSNSVGGQRAFEGTVSASAITYRVWCSR